MTFIEINSTVCVNKNQISWVASENDGLSSIIFIGGKEFPSDIPYQTLISLISQPERNDTMEKLDKYLSVATVTTL